MMAKIEKKPKWIRVKLPTGKKYTELRSLVDKYKLNTICSSGSCPNMGECWGEGTATFMILGNICTRSCGFCGVKTGRPESVDWEEPEKVANSIKIMKIKHAVLTSVDRDDLRDMGTLIWTETVKSIRRISPETTLETLIPDFQGIEKHLDKIFEKKILSEDISYYLHRPSATDPNMAPNGQDAFYVLVPVPNNLSNINWSNEGDKFKNLILDKMDNSVLPGIKENVVSDFYLTPNYFEKELATLHGSGFSIQPKFSQSAYFRFHNQSEVFKNLYFVGAGTHPGAGMPGVLSSAKVLDRLF